MARTNLPEHFLTGLRESYKYFLYRVLLNHRHGETRMSFISAIAEMLQIAWPYVCTYNMSLGRNDHLEVLCRKISATYGNDAIPDYRTIFSELKSGSYSASINDVSRVFFRMADAWVGRTSNLDSEWLHSQSNTSSNLFPYYLEDVDGDNIICINESWTTYVDSQSMSESDYLDAFHLFMGKRNRGTFKRDLKYLSLNESSTSTQDDFILPEGISQKTFSVLENIPLDFLNREPKVIEKNSGFEYLKTHPQLDIHYIGDLFKVSLEKRVIINVLKNYVQKNAERLASAYAYYSDLPSIPRNVTSSEPMGYAIRNFIHEYIDRLTERNTFLIPRERERRNVRLKIFSTLYDDRVATATRKELANELGLHPERIRQLQVGNENSDGVEACSQILQGAIVSDDFVVNPFLQTEFINFSLSNFQAERQDTFDAQLGIVDCKTRAFFFAVMGLHQTDTIRYIEPFFIKGENVTVINKNIVSIMKYFNDTLHYVYLESEVIPFLHKQLHLEYEVIDVVIEIIRHSCLFESNPSANAECYRLKWEHLLTDSARLARILMDIGEPVHYTVVFDEYQRRAKSCSLEIKSVEEHTNIKHPFIKTRGKMGVWEYSEENNRSNSNSATLREIIEQFVIKNKGVTTVADVENYLESLSLPNKTRSIKTYLSSICWLSRSSDVYVHRSFEHLFELYNIRSVKINDSNIVIPFVLKTLADNGGSATIRMVTDAYKEKSGNSIRGTSLRMMLAKFDDIIASETNGRRVKLRLRIPADEIDNVDLTRVVDKQFPRYYTQVMDSLTCQLESAPEHCLKLSVALKEAYQYIPSDKHKNIVYKIIPRMDNVEVFEVEGKKFLKLKQ